MKNENAVADIIGASLSALGVYEVINILSMVIRLVGKIYLIQILLRVNKKHHRLGLLDGVFIDFGDIDFAN